MKKKLFSLLVLLVAAVSGAWADAVPAYNLSVEASKHGTGTVKFFVNSMEVTGADEGDMVTMTVTPDAGWIVDKAKVSATTYGNWEAAGARRNVQGDVPFLGDVTLTAVETAENTWTFQMPAANVKVKAEYLKISTLTFDPADKTDLMEVKVGDETVTPDQEGKLTEILEGLPVKLTAKQGYKFSEYSNGKAYGICYYNNGESWPLGFITFDVDDPSNVTSLNGDISSYYGLDYCSADQYYYAVDNNLNLIKMDLNGNVVATVATLNTQLNDGAWNATNNTMYAVYSNDIYTVDLSTGELNTLATSADNTFKGIACNADGQLYTIMSDGKLYTVNATTGELTLVGDTGYSPNYAQSLQFDKKTGKLYWCFSDDNYDHFMQVDPTTGVATMLQEYTGETTGLCFPLPLIYFSATGTTFAMPADDATVEYEIVRDMEYKVNAYVGDNADATYRHRVELVGNNIYKPMGITNNAQITALFNVVDYIDAANPKALVYGTDFTVAIVDKDENEINPAEFNFAPGTYTIKVTGIGDYDGVIDSQNAFKLYLGVDVTVPAGELVTYYSDETLYTEEEDAEIYTITDVSGTEATATELTIVPANTPFLVKNTADEKMTFLFIVTDGDQLPAVNYYPGFTGTLDATTIDASTADQTNYAFNGKEFVYVKNAINIGANKAWLEVANANARALTIVFGEATGINSMVNGQWSMDTWYDLQGRRVQKPTKGVFIRNGRKVVVK